VSRTVVVTGGAKGIGRAIIDDFAAAGDRVIAIGRDAGALAALPHASDVCDVTDEGAVVALFARIGAVDVLVNNAGVSSSAPLHRTPLGDWEHQLAVNATGAFLCARAVLPGMRERDRGRIVTVASVASHRGARYVSAYVASKHAVLGLTRAIAAEVAGSGVTCNAVCPSYVRSPMTDATIANIERRTGREGLPALVGVLGRLVEPAEVAFAVRFFAASEAGAINGQSLIIDGGDVQQ
jgi:NAD(P)-dependent dehydrogenase (short-subunit alcohol dehydrogenase family)